MIIIERNDACKWAIQHMVNEVHNLSKLDQCTTTYIQTKAIVENGILDPVGRISIQEIEVIVNLKRAWKFLINNYDVLELSINTIGKFHEIVGHGLVINAGTIRNGDVGVNNVNWQPSIPNYENVVKIVNEILCIIEPIDRCINLLCYLIRNQLFYDANKRNAFIIANLILIKENIGIISVPEELYWEFNELLKLVFDKNDIASMRKFILEKCLNYQPNYIKL